MDRAARTVFGPDGHATLSSPSPVARSRPLVEVDIIKGVAEDLAARAPESMKTRRIA